MSKEYIASTANNKQVFVTDHSHAATHLTDTPQLLDVVKELLRALSIEADNVYFEKDMGRSVGLTDLVETSENDTIVYAKRLNRTNFTRFAMNRQAEPTPYVTVVLKRRDDEYELWSAWIGRAAPQFPGDEHETPVSREFWRHHALVLGNQAVQPDTFVHEWPWGDKAV